MRRQVSMESPRQQPPNTGRRQLSSADATTKAAISKPQSTSGPVYFNLAVQDEEEDEQHWWGTAAAEATALPAPYPKKKKNKKKKKQKKSQMANPISEEVAMLQSTQAKVTEECITEEAKAIGAGNKEAGKSKLFSTSSEWGSEKVRTAKLPQAITTIAFACPAAAATATVTSTKRWADMAEDSDVD